MKCIRIYLSNEIRRIGGREYYVGTVGNVTEDAIKKYIAAQEIYAETEDQPKKNFF